MKLTPRWAPTSSWRLGCRCFVTLMQYAFTTTSHGLIMVDPNRALRTHSCKHLAPCCVGGLVLCMPRVQQRMPHPHLLLFKHVLSVLPLHAVCRACVCTTMS